jgi:pimeloyl-ACP methyl ester carboxylesterase
MTTTPQTTRTPTTNTSKTPETVIVTAGGVRLCYDTFGDPTHPPLLLIQGLGAHMLGWHHNFCTQLADTGFWVIRHDNRDIGRSQHYPDGGYTLADMARDSVELLNALGHDSAHIVGQSMGGMIAQQVAIDHPTAVRTLTLIYTTAHNGHILADEVDKRRHLPAARNRAEAIERFLQNEAPCATERYPHDEVWLRELGGLMHDRDHDPAAAERQLAALYTAPDRRPALTAITSPTTIVHGDGDKLIDPAASRELHATIASSTLTIYPGMGHSLPRSLWPDIITEIRHLSTHNR